jgi:hypothetical protein
MRKVDTNSDALSRFASRLLGTPALRLLPALQKEEQALQFLRANGPQLLPVFASLGIAQAQGWREAASQVAHAVRVESDRLLEHELSVVSTSRLTLSFFPAMTGGRHAPAAARAELLALFQRSARHPVSRSALAGSLSAARSDLTDKYIPQACERKKYIYVEVARVQRLSLPAADLADLVRFAVMIRPAAYLFMTPGATPEKDAGYSALQEQYLQKVMPSVAVLLPSIPPALLQAGLRSTLPFPTVTGVEAVSRLAAIFALRGRALSPGVIVDRGADTPDKSWFNVNRRNARWHGVDPGMLDELYTIASENRW